MNNQRRKAIADIIAQLDDLAAAVEMLQDEEQGYLDSMPENLQKSEKAEMAQDAINALESAIDAIEDVKAYLDEAGQ